MDYFEQIEAYLNNILPESDKVAFEEAMNSDEKLKQAVEDHSIAMDVVGSILEDEVRKVIEDEELIINNEQLIIDNGGEERGLERKEGVVIPIDGEAKEGAVVKRMNWMRWASAAAVVFVVGWWGMGEFSHNMLEQDIHDNYYERTETSVVRGELSNASSKDSIMYYYSLNNFEKSLDLIVNKKENDSDKFYIRFKAHNLFNLEKYNDVIDLLENKGSLTPELNELIMFSLLLEGKKTKAKSRLQNLTAERKEKVEKLFK